jgi:site-specific DNA recombinase
MKAHRYAAECKVNGSLPFGYKKGEDGKYAIDESRAAIVREIFSKVADGIPYADIIRSLNDRGILTKTRKPFNKNSFTRMLKNERYIGVYEHSGVRVVGGVPAIISEEVFLAVQRKLQEGANSEGAKRKSNSDYLLTGKLFCGECGSPMVGCAGTSRNGTLHYYYTCKSRGKNGCKKHNIRRDFLEQFVVDLTRECISQAEVIEWLVSGYIELKKQARETSDVPVMEEELASRKKALDNIMKAIEAGIFNETTSERMRELETEIHDLERSIALGKAMFEEPVDGERMRFYLEKLRNGTTDNQAYRQELLRTMVKTIRLWDDHIEIEYNFTGTDGSGNNYRVAKEFLKGESIADSDVRISNAQPHHNWTPILIQCVSRLVSNFLQIP